MLNQDIFSNAKQMWTVNAEQISDLAHTIEAKTYNDIYNMIANCKGRIATMGMGTSGIAARKIAHMLCVANIPSWYVSPGDAAHGAFGSVAEGDVLIMLSKGGATEELVNLLESIKEKSIKLITITHNIDSPLAKAADVVLQLKTIESDHKKMLPTASILAIISIFDAIADELTKGSQFSDRLFYLNHNHGAVGAKLKQAIQK
jgi:arabinose-5-phosphate isomerase